MLMRFRSTRGAIRFPRTLTAGVLAAVTVGALAACGDDSSTADSEGTASSTPSVVVPANPTTSGQVVTTTPNPHSGDGAGSGGAQDGGISEITELPPASAVRDEADDAFLDELKGRHIDIADQVVQDQVIAAAHEQCQANEEGRPSFAVPAIAGQLQALGATDEDPEVVAAAIKAAAEANYCS
ncbi:DUF732 domain-containing protein [uncultured Corynebacterium sp.]|uniref:DUF732 domain-containing protein n=1 Tax=uncultured Corynebacterium sp. TaxID=159447 RepID=UPI0025EF3DE5|nr:DUF732 domain-containing protein [uncultured Corynebacterium sp.]